MIQYSKKIFVDTSAFYALIDRSDQHHHQASAIWSVLLKNEVAIITTNYVMCETIHLLQSRISFDAASICHRDILGITDVYWVDADLHQKAYTIWLNSRQKGLSLIDCVSFITIHQHEIEKVFSFKNCFRNQGIEVLE